MIENNKYTVSYIMSFRGVLMKTTFEPEPCPGLGTVQDQGKAYRHRVNPVRLLSLNLLQNVCA